jgi:hypothetical protein
LGRYRGIDKAYRKLQAEAKKANLSHGLDRPSDTLLLHTGEELGLESFLVDESSGHPRLPATGDSDAQAAPGTPFLGPGVRTPGKSTQFENQDNVEEQDGPVRTQEPMGNPLALLAYASDAAQASEIRPMSANTLPCPTPRSQTGPVNGQSEGHYLLHRPGYVSLGLQLERGSLVQGLDSLLTCVDAGHHSLDYFKRTGFRQRDVGPDLDPVELGLVTMDDANYLFPM